MLTQNQFVEMALSFPGTEQKPHFERLGFKVLGKRMFATYLASDHTANIFLTPVMQTAFLSLDEEGVYPVPNKWGEKGATTFDLNLVPREVVQEALTSAYKDARKPKKR